MLNDFLNREYCCLFQQHRAKPHPCVPSVEVNGCVGKKVNADVRWRTVTSSNSLKVTVGGVVIKDKVKRLLVQTPFLLDHHETKYCMFTATEADLVFTIKCFGDF